MPEHFLLLFFLAMDLLLSAVGFFLCLSDKRRAKKGRWRVPEKSFFLLALFGGGIGVLLGMYRVRHKTRHMSFVFGIPALTVLNLTIQVLLLCFYYGIFC